MSSAFTIQCCDSVLEVVCEDGLSNAEFDRAVKEFAIAPVERPTLRVTHSLHTLDEVVHTLDLGEETVTTTVPGWRFDSNPSQGWVIFQKLYFPDLEPSRFFKPVMEFVRDLSEVRVRHYEAPAQPMTVFGAKERDLLFLSRFGPTRSHLCFHSSAAKIGEKGLLFLGQGGAGKSTLAHMVSRVGGEILSDEANLVNLAREEVTLHGAWLHSNFETTSNRSIPLHGVFIINQAKVNRLARVTDHREAYYHLIRFLNFELTDAAWWKTTTDLLEKMARRIPMYHLYFDLSGAITDQLAELPDE